MEHALSDDGYGDTKFVLQFRTMGAETLCLKMLEQNHWADLRDLLVTTLSHPESRSVGGNVFEGAAHRIIPTLFSLKLFKMDDRKVVRVLEAPPRKVSRKVSRKALKKVPKKVEVKKVEASESPFVLYNRTASMLEVDFKREHTTSFTYTAPHNIELDHYYRGCRTTPLIDGFLVHREKGKFFLYLIQITTSEKKESLSLVKGPALVKTIVQNLKLKSRLPVKLRFVLIGPTADISGAERLQTWKLPSHRHFHSPYEVYAGTIPIPHHPPG